MKSIRTQKRQATINHAINAITVLLRNFQLCFPLISRAHTISSAVISAKHPLLSLSQTLVFARDLLLSQTVEFIVIYCAYDPLLQTLEFTCCLLCWTVGLAGMHIVFSELKRVRANNSVVVPSGAITLAVYSVVCISVAH